MSEIELKLRGTPARLKAAMARLQKTASKIEPFKKDLRAVYFDTAKDDLHAKGLSFRVREEDGRFVQTLKRVGVDSDALTRGEWSDRISAAAPELLKTYSGRKLREVWKDVRLLPRFRTSIARTGFVFSPKAGTKIEVVRDEGEIRAIVRDDAIEPVSEIELELKEGSLGLLYGVALEIVAKADVAIEARSKSDRGYALLSPGSENVAVKAEAFLTKGSQTLAEVLRDAARRHFSQFLLNMPGALKHDPASIHQMRVSIRRLRSALYGVREWLPEAHYEAVRSKLKQLLQSLGAARDWEVLTERMSELEDEEDIEQIQRAAARRKSRALDEAVEAVGSRAMTVVLLEAMRWFEDLPTARFARKLKVRARAAAGAVLSGVFARVRRRGRRYEAQSVGERHRLRIAVKNLRYNVELYSALYPNRKVEKFLRLLRPVQDDLGSLNDASRARDLLSDLAKRSPQKEAAAAVVARLEARVAAADKRARKRITAMRAAAPFWA